MLGTYQFDAAIEAIVMEHGNITAIPAGVALDAGQTYLRRGELLLALADFQAEVGKAYYTKRAASDEIGSSRYTPYYRARYVHSAGEPPRGHSAVRGGDPKRQSTRTISSLCQSVAWGRTVHRTRELTGYGCLGTN